MLEKNDVTVHAKMNCEKHKQKLLIHALLKCSELNLEIMASILSVPLITLKDVYNGACFFPAAQAEELVQLFLIRFTDHIIFVD